MRLLLSITLLSLPFTLVACASVSGPGGGSKLLPSNAIVIPRSNNQIQAVSVGKTKQAALQDAVNGASNHCIKQQSSLLVQSEQVKYIGLLPEKAQQTVDAVGQAVKDYSPIPLPKLDNKTPNFEVTLNFGCQAVVVQKPTL